MPVGIVCPLRDAKLAEVRVFSDPDAALRHAGLGGEAADSERIAAMSSSLPPAGEPAFYAAGAAGREGPMTRDELAERVRDGRLAPNVHVWWPGLQDWVTLDTRPELLAGPEAPPPPPPAPQLEPLARPQPPGDQLDEVFAGLVETSWRHHRLLEDTQRVDDVLVGALITATLDTGRALLDIESDGTNHFLRFEDPSDRSRVSMAVTHITRDATTARAIGQRAAVTVAYGEAITRFGQVVEALRKQAKSGYVKSAEPGIVTFEKDDVSKYLYAQIDLYLDIDEYISPAFEVDYEKLTRAVAACVHALRKFLEGRVEEEEEAG